jgi:hypothetical protein
MANLFSWLGNLFSGSTTTDPPEVVTIPGWTVEVSGIVKGVTRLNVDKSGRNPRYNYFMTVERETVNYDNCDFELELETQFTAKEKLLTESLGRPIQRGDRVAIKSSGAGRKPRMLPIRTIALVES